MTLFKPDIDEMERKRDLNGLLRALKYRDAGVRTRAAWALGGIGDKRAVPHLIKALKDRDAKVRREAACALGLISDKRAVPALITALKDDNDLWVRWQATAALGLIGDKRAVPYLIEVLKEDRDTEVRRWAAWALAKCADGSAVEPLEELLESRGSVNWKIKQIVRDIVERLKSSGAYERYLLQKARNYELACRYEDAAEIYEKLGRWEDAGRVRKLAQRPKAMTQNIMAGKIDMSTKTEIKDSTLLRSQVNSTNAKTEIKDSTLVRSQVNPSNAKPLFEICPYCGVELKLPETPHFCPYCRKRLW